MTKVPKATEADEKQVLPHRVERDPAFSDIYTNFIQSGYTFFDVSLEFSENRGMSGDELLNIKRARVTMAPAEAKILANIVHNVVKGYEKQFGEIKIPEGIMIHRSED